MNKTTLSISSGNSNKAYLVVNKTLDFETTPKYELTIRAANRQAKSNVDRMSDTITVHVEIEDENEPPIWSNNKVVFNENVKAGKFYIEFMLEFWTVIYHRCRPFKWYPSSC